METNTPLPDGTWVHSAAVVEGPTTMRLHEDGVEVPGTASGTAAGALVHTIAGLQSAR